LRIDRHFNDMLRTRAVWLIHCIYGFVKSTAHTKYSWAAQKLSSGRMRPPCQGLDHADLRSLKNRRSAEYFQSKLVPACKAK